MSTSGTYKDDWAPTSNPDFKCPECKTSHIYFRLWESDDGAFEDYQYRCQTCRYEWWVEGPDA